MPDLLRLSEVKERLALSHPTIYRLIKAGKFPPPVKIGHIARWRSDEVSDWVAKQLPQVTE